MRLRTSLLIMLRIQLIMSFKTIRNLSKIMLRCSSLLQISSSRLLTSLREITKSLSICSAMISSFMLISIGLLGTDSLNGLISQLSQMTRNQQRQSGTTAIRKTKSSFQFALSFLMHISNYSKLKNSVSPAVNL